MSRSFPVPTWRLAVVAAASSLVAAGLPLAAPEGLAVVDGLLFGVAITDWVLTIAPVRVSISRVLPDSLTIGQEGTVSWTVTNPHARRRLHLSLADDLMPSLRAGNRRSRLVVGAGGTTTASTTLHPARRGDFRPRTLVVRVDGPFRLMSRQASRGEPGLLRVLPRFRSRQDAELRINRARILEQGLRSAQGRGGGTEFEQLRDYGIDDEFRRIDWPATARFNRPIVRTFRAERNQTVMVLLDNGRTMSGKVAGVPRVEHAMDAAMMLTAIATRLGDRTGLVAFDSRVRAVVPPSTGKNQLRHVVDALYRLQPELAESDYRAAFAETLARFRRRFLLVVLTELADQALTETLVRDLGLVVRHHLVIVAAVRDPEVDRWADGLPSEAGATYLKSAALAARASRSRLTAQLTGRGATVLDAVPGQLAPRLADEYLRVKSRGQL